MSSITSGVHTGSEPPVWYGAKPPKHEKYAENLIECHKFHTAQTKKISVAISELYASDTVPCGLRTWASGSNRIKCNEGLERRPARVQCSSKNKRNLGAKYLESERYDAFRGHSLQRIYKG